MSSGVLHRLTEKKGKQLSKFLGIDSAPSTLLIANMQARINNPLFKLSMTDYEAICGNKMMVKLMSKVIGCEEKQLKKFCKYINVFAENIKSSPKSIKNKMKVTNSINASKRKGSLYVLPDDILEKIVNKYKTIFKIKYKLKDWIPPKKLDWASLSSNPNAIELLKENPTKIVWWKLSSNPNEGAIELLKANPKKIDWRYLSRNPSAIELLKENPENINWYLISANPNAEAIKLLRKNPENIHWSCLSENSAAIELLKANHNEIIWGMLSANPAAMDLLKENPDEIDWGYLSANPNQEAIELLKANQDKIDWEALSKNPNNGAIELLKTKINEENEMSEDDYDDLDESNKIDWFNLSSNPNAIELLKANPKKIDWEGLSGNPAIFDEILE